MSAAPPPGCHAFPPPTLRCCNVTVVRCTKLISTPDPCLLLLGGDPLRGGAGQVRGGDPGHPGGGTGLCRDSARLLPARGDQRGEDCYKQSWADVHCSLQVNCSHCFQESPAPLPSPTCTQVLLSTLGFTVMYRALQTVFCSSPCQAEAMATYHVRESKFMDVLFQHGLKKKVSVFIRNISTYYLPGMVPGTADRHAPASLLLPGPDRPARPAAGGGVRVGGRGGIQG